MLFTQDWYNNKTVYTVDTTGADSMSVMAKMISRVSSVNVV
jgi:hypothetical protein